MQQPLSAERQKYESEARMSRVTIENMRALKAATSRTCVKQIEVAHRDIEEFGDSRKAHDEKNSSTQDSFRSSIIKSDSLERENARLRGPVQELESDLQAFRNRAAIALRAIRGTEPPKRATKTTGGFLSSPFRRSIQ
jgi:hypothetical protein